MLVEVLLFVMCFIIIGLSLILILTLRNGSQSGDGIVTVLVMGDIGRSPRMVNHAVSFAKREKQVQLIGYGGSKPHKRLTSCSNIHIFHVIDTPEFHKYLPKLLAYAVKVVWQSTFLLWKLCQTDKSSHLIMQTPPAIPTLAVAWLFCLFRCTRLLVDWHNYGYSILALATRSNHPLVVFSKWYEKWFGQCAYWGFCVTQAMQDDLRDNWDMGRTDVLYDRPADQFTSINDDVKHRLFMKLSQDMKIFRGKDSSSSAFTTSDAKGTRLLPDRPALLVSSTSWTEDEDFTILLSALDSYDKMAMSETKQLPVLVCAITGKGPQKERYIQEISERQWIKVSAVTPWLEAEDYPKLLGAADLGVCLHYSSSGLDLPMKVVDMFGTGLPVCAINFKCLSELVKPDKNGLIFNTADELANQIARLLEGFPTEQELLSKYRENLKSFQELTWEQHWDKVVLPRL